MTTDRDFSKVCNISRKQFLTGVLTGLALSALTGCGKAGSTPQSAAPAPQSSVHMVVAFDYSQSCHDQLPTAVRQTCALPGSLDPDKDHLTVVRLAYTVEEILDQQVPEDEDKLQELLIERLKDLPAVNGTRSALLWKDMQQRLSNEQRPTGIAIWSDADDDESSSASRQAIAEAARQLAANPNIVFVAILGIRPENRATLRAQFQPMGDRLHLYDIREATLEPLLNTLGQARR